MQTFTAIELSKFCAVLTLEARHRLVADPLPCMSRISSFDSVWAVSSSVEEKEKLIWCTGAHPLSKFLRPFIELFTQSIVGYVAAESEINGYRNSTNSGRNFQKKTFEIFALRAQPILSIFFIPSRRTSDGTWKMWKLMRQLRPENGLEIH